MEFQLQKASDFKSLWGWLSDQKRLEIGIKIDRELDPKWIRNQIQNGCRIGPKMHAELDPKWIENLVKKGAGLAFGIIQPRGLAQMKYTTTQEKWDPKMRPAMRTCRRAQYNPGDWKYIASFWHCSFSLFSYFLVLRRQLEMSVTFVKSRVRCWNFTNRRKIARGINPAHSRPHIKNFAADFCEAERKNRCPNLGNF